MGMVNNIIAAVWLDSFSAWVDKINGWVWGAPLILTILSVGILLTICLRFKHIANLFHAFSCIFKGEKSSHGEVSAFGALCTALSATIGTGNIVGVATAVGTGGPGALFWMEVSALLGMATKYAEGLLAVKYREVLPDGRVLGGPFYYIEKGLGPKWKPLAVVFAFFGVCVGLFGIGTFSQVHGITSAVQGFSKAVGCGSDICVEIFGVSYTLPVILSGFVVTICTALVIIGGLKRISSVSSVVVPVMAVTYVAACLGVLILNVTKIPEAVSIIVRAAFDPQAVTGGAVGSLFIAMQRGVARGIFSNEAGLGSAPIAAAAAKTNEPAKQGLVCMTGTFIDTIIVCSMTGLVIVITGAWQPELKLEGVAITAEAFRRAFSFAGSWSEIAASFMLMSSLTLFAFTTILGWNYYSEKCLEYLVGPHRSGIVKMFRVAYVLMVFIGPYFTLAAVWGIADIANGLMAFPNLIALVLLTPVTVKVSKDYFNRLSKGDSADEE
jgi:AGCS family alanine or glycine:cation symporter